MQKKDLINIGSLLIALLLSAGTANSELYAQNPVWHSFEEALERADTANRPILVDVWAPWCGWCHKMKQEVYPELASKLNDQFVNTRLNRDDHDEIHRYKEKKYNSFRLARKLNAESVPTIVFLSSDGDYLLHLSGFIEAEELHPVLDYIATKSYRHQTFQAFVKQRES